MSITSLQRHQVIPLVALLVPFGLLLGISFDLYIPSVPQMSRALNVTSVEIQSSLSAFMYTFGVGQLFMGPLADKFGRRTVLLLCMLLFIIGSLGCVFAMNLSALIGGRILQAAGGAGTSVVVFAVIRDTLDGDAATIAFTYIKSAMGIAPILAPTIGATVGVHCGWRMNFVLLAILGGAIFLLGWIKLHETNLPHKKFIPLFEHIKPFKIIALTPQFWFFSMATIAAQAAMFGYFLVSPVIFIEQAGFSEAGFALLFSLNALFFLVTGFIAGHFIPRFGLVKSIRFAAGLLGVSGLLMAWASIQWASHYLTLLLPNLIASGSCAILLGTGSSGALQPFKNIGGAASALVGCCEFVGGGLIGSTVLYYGSASSFNLSIVLGIMGSLMMLWSTLTLKYAYFRYV